MAKDKFKDAKYGLCKYCAHYNNPRILKPCATCKRWFGKTDNWEKADGAD